MTLVTETLTHSTTTRRLRRRVSRLSRQSWRAVAQTWQPLPRAETGWSWWSRQTRRGGCVGVSRSRSTVGGNQYAPHPAHRHRTPSGRVRDSSSPPGHVVLWCSCVSIIVSLLWVWVACVALSTDTRTHRTSRRR